ncbi:hypothetical protein [Bradyrhizobium monzae]|uniref:hypothetical protein n=1 Tax=Bradyrhizobium sp. Oc8 TaxID=2876780 RepID=UPI001F2ED01E|nr:hypothetical protein [Bradyrhizobium sp. Oc8]
MVASKTVCLRRLSRGDRALEVRFNRFLGHDKVTAERIVEGWSERTTTAVEGRHVLAIQDTSEIHFNTTPQRRRGLGEIGKGNNYGVLLHPLLAVDADDGASWAFERTDMDAQRPPYDPARRSGIIGQGIAALDIHHRCGQAAAHQGLGGDSAG